MGTAPEYAAIHAMRSCTQGSLLVTFSPPVPTPPPPAQPPSPPPAHPPSQPCPVPVKVVPHPWSLPSKVESLSTTIQLDQSNFTLPPIGAAHDCKYSPVGEYDFRFTGGDVGVKAALVRLVGLQPGSAVTLSTCDAHQPYGPDMDVAVYTGGAPMLMLTFRIRSRSVVSLRLASGREGEPCEGMRCV